MNLDMLLRLSGLSQARLAQRTGLRPGTVSALASGKARGIQFDTLTRILDGLWDELGKPFGVENLLHYESERHETLPDGRVIATDQYGLRYYLEEDGLYRPVPRRRL
ncbi:helix-turn-helix domain-containing protein [Deinococcus reticulitermitis]|nr:helix-turn-helix transcriptional regulator [Deinococcus reticulitermitis]